MTLGGPGDVTSDAPAAAAAQGDVRVGRGRGVRRIANDLAGAGRTTQRGAIPIAGDELQGLRRVVGGGAGFAHRLLQVTRRLAWSESPELSLEMNGRPSTCRSTKDSRAGCSTTWGRSGRSPEPISQPLLRTSPKSVPKRAITPIRAAGATRCASRCARVPSHPRTRRRRGRHSRRGRRQRHPWTSRSRRRRDAGSPLRG